MAQSPDADTPGDAGEVANRKPIVEGAAQEADRDGVMRGVRIWLAGMASWLRRAALRAAIVSGLVVPTLLMVREFGPQSLADPVRAAERFVMVTSGLRAPEPPGIVYMGAPQVFTRERLVNDRFEQANWLRAELARTQPTSDAPDFLTPGRTYQVSAEGRIGVGAAPAGGDSVAPVDRPALDPRHVFERALAYRQLLRNELLDVQLDDGHDLDGNSLYRFKFDAVALPWANLRADPGSAVFIVTAKRPTFGAANPPGPAQFVGALTKDPKALAEDMTTFANGAGELAAEAKALADNLKIFSNGAEATTIAAGARAAGAATPVSDAQTRERDVRLFASEADGIADRARALFGETDARISAAKALEQTIHDDVMLLRDFRREMQMFLDNIIRERTTAFDVTSKLANPVDPKEDLALERFLRNRMIFTFIDMLRRHQRQSETAPPSPAEDPCTAGQCPAFKRLAEMVGVRYDADEAAWDFSHPAVARRFHDAIEIAHAVNLLQWPRVGDQVYQGDCGPFEHRPSLQTRIESPLVWSAMDEKAPNGAEGSAKSAPSKECRPERYKDPERKRAMLRLIAVIEAMDAFATSAPVSLSDVNEKQEASGDASAEIIDKFGGLLPTHDDLAELERATRQAHQRERYLITKESGELPSEVMALSSADFYAPVRDRECEPLRTPKATFDDLLAYAKCMFLYQTDLKVANAMTRFVHDRMTRYSNTYEGYELRVLDYLDLELDESSCRQATCRILVKPWRQRKPRRDAAPSPEVAAAPAGDGFPPAAASWRAHQLELLKQTTGDFEADAPTGDAMSPALRNPEFQCAEVHGAGEAETRLFPAVADMRNVENRLLIESDAARLLGRDELRREIATACKLAGWLNTRRSDLGVYSVDPRIEGEVRDWRRAVTAAAGGKLGDVVASGSRRDAEAGVQLAPAIVGFGTMRRDGSTKSARNPDEARFGWVVRPIRQGDGYWAPATQRLAAVLSIPSWWSQIEFEIVGCWIAPVQHRYKLGKLSKINEMKQVCDAVGAQPLKFLVRLPRHVEEAIDRFNFDFIKAPYFNSASHGRHEHPLALEVGRKGSLVLAGTRLWRGTVVTLGSQVADRILVLPDMKGVIAEFECVRPFAAKGGHTNSGFVQVWTSEGATTRMAVEMIKFSASGGERPCYVK